MARKAAKMTEAEMEAKEKKIREQYEAIQQGYINLAADLDEVRMRGVFRPGTFAEWVKDHFPFSVREAHRLATDHAVVQVTRRLFRQAPKTPYAARTLAPFADDFDAMKRIQEKLQGAGLSIATAKVTEIQKAIKSAGLAGRRIKPGPKVKP